MTNIAKWNAAISWTTALSTELNSLASGDVAIAGTAIDNTTNLYTDGWVSFSFPTGSTGTGAPYIGVYLLPLNEDGTSYGDGSGGGAVVPGAIYQVASIQLQPSQSSVTLVGQAYIGQIPPNKFKLAVLNETGNALAATGNVLSFSSNAINLNG